MQRIRNLKPPSREKVVQSITSFLKVFFVEAILLFGFPGLFFLSLSLAYELAAVGAITYSNVEFIRVAFIVTTMVYGSMLLLGYRHYLAGHPMWCESVSPEIDDHYRVCCLVGRQSDCVLDGFRRRGKPCFARSDHVSTKERLETSMLWMLMLLLVAAIGFLFSRVPNQDIRQMGQVTMIASAFFVFLTLYDPIYTTVREFQSWRDFWIGYWEFVRDMCAPFNRLLDQQSTWSEIDTAFLWGAVPDQDYERYVRSTLKAAQKKHLNRRLVGRWTWPDVSKLEQFIDRVIWYEEMKDRISEIEVPDDTQMDENQVIFENLESVKRLDLPDTFHYVYRGYRKLCSVHLFSEWPEIMREVDNAIADASSDQRKDILEISSDRLRDFRELPHVPIPGSMKWVALLYALVIASSEYVAPILSMLLGFPVVT